MDVGLELRQARERQGMSLEQISRKTKISLRVLRAIEASDETALPARVFTRSFVKTLAEEVGLDPDSTMRRYLEQVEQLEPPAAADVTHVATETPSVVAREALVLPAVLTARVLRGRVGTATVLILTGLAAFLLAVKEGKRGQSVEKARPPASARAVKTPGIGSAGTAPSAVGTSGFGRSDASGPTPSSSPSNGLSLSIAPTGPCWVQANVGDQTVLAKLLDAGDHRVVDSPSDVTLRVGDPATFAFSINGKAARIPGTAGKAVTVQLTKENYSRFLVP